jgi:hypothetical protein
MAVINKTGITNGTTIQAEHVTRTIDALSGVSTDTILATGSFTGSLVGALTGTASFATTALSASYAANVPSTASYALTALSSSYAVTASYALNAGGGTGVGFPFTGSAQVTGSMGITGSLNVTGGVTASLFGTASRSTTASFADTADQLLVQRTTTEASFYPVIADSGNAIPTAERLKTTTNITINPGTNVITGATFEGSFIITGSVNANKFSTVDLRVLGEASAGGQMAIPIQQTGGTPLAGSIYWDDAGGRLYIYSAANAAWYNIPLNP